MEGEAGWIEWKSSHSRRVPVYVLYEIATEDSPVHQSGLSHQFGTNTTMPRKIPVSGSEALHSIREVLNQSISQNQEPSKDESLVSCVVGWQVHEHMPTRRKCAGCKESITKSKSFFSYKRSERSKAVFVHRDIECVKKLAPDLLALFNRYWLVERQHIAANRKSVTGEVDTPIDPIDKTRETGIKTGIERVTAHDVDVNVPFYLTQKRAGPNQNRHVGW